MQVNTMLQLQPLPLPFMSTVMQTLACVLCCKQGRKKLVWLLAPLVPPPFFVSSILYSLPYLPLIAYVLNWFPSQPFSLHSFSCLFVSIALSLLLCLLVLHLHVAMKHLVAFGLYQELVPVLVFPSIFVLHATAASKRGLECQAIATVAQLKCTRRNDGRSPGHDMICWM